MQTMIVLASLLAAVLISTLPLYGQGADCDSLHLAVLGLHPNTDSSTVAYFQLVKRNPDGLLSCILDELQPDLMSWKVGILTRSLKFVDRRNVLNMVIPKFESMRRFGASRVVAVALFVLHDVQWLSTLPYRPNKRLIPLLMRSITDTARIEWIGGNPDGPRTVAEVAAISLQQWVAPKVLPAAVRNFYGFDGDVVDIDKLRQMSAAMRRWWCRNSKRLIWSTEIMSFIVK